MKVLATFITATSLLLWFAVQSQVDQCDYRINADPNNVGLIGVYFPQVNLSEEQSLLVSYYYNSKWFTDEYSYANSTTFLNRSQAMTRCFDGNVSTSNVSIFWSEEPITITQTNLGKNVGDCTSPSEVYAATYFAESCFTSIELSSLGEFGSFSYPNYWATYPCHTRCTWIIQSTVIGESSVAIWIKSLTGSGSLSIKSLKNNECMVFGQVGVSELYVSDFSTYVSINFVSSEPGEKFTVDYKLIDPSAHRDTDCSVGNVTVGSNICTCDCLVRDQCENAFYEKERSTYIAKHYNKDETIINVTATDSPQQITCRKCATILSTTTAGSESSTTTSISTSFSTATRISTTTPSTTTATVQSSSSTLETTSTPVQVTSTTNYFTATIRTTEYTSPIFTSRHTITEKTSTEDASTVTKYTTTTTSEVTSRVSYSSTTQMVTIVDTTTPAMASVNSTFAPTTQTSQAIITSGSDTTTPVYTEASTSLTATSNTAESSTSTSGELHSTPTSVSTTARAISTAAATSELIRSTSTSLIATTSSLDIHTSQTATTNAHSTTTVDTLTTSLSKRPTTTTTTDILTTSTSKLPNTTTTDTLRTSSSIPATTTTIPSDDLSNIKNNINRTNVGMKMKQLTNALLNITTYLTPEDVSDAVTALSKAANISDISPDVGQDFDKAADLTLRNGSESFTSETTTMLLDAVKSYGENVYLNVGQSSESYGGSSFVNVVTVVNCSYPIFQIGLVDLIDDKNATAVGKIFSDDTRQDYLVKGMVGFIAIDQKVICSNESQETNSGETESTRVSFQIYRTTTIFSTDATTNMSLTRSSYCEQTYHGDVVVSATVLERLNNQSAPQMSVQIGFQRSLDTQNQSESRNYRTYCGFWQSGSWMDNGSVQLFNQSGDTFIFQSDHLTDFTLLTSSSSNERIFCDTSLDILGTVGSSCSFAGLIFMSISLSIIWWAKLSTSPIVLISLFFNFSFALFFICFIIFADQLTLNISGSTCTAFAAVMYYLLMSTIMWTCCRAALVYKRYVIVFDTGGTSKIFSFNKVSTFVCTAVPLVVVLAVALTDNDFFEREDHFCWINPAYVVYAVVIPIAVMLVMSILVLIMVVRSVFFSFHPETSVYRSTKNDRKSFRRKIWVLFVIQISLGLPWIFLYLTEIPGTSVFHYLFTITNAFQGVWIAALHFYERRKHLGKLLRQATLRRSAHHSIVTQTSSIDSSKSQ